MVFVACTFSVLIINSGGFSWPFSCDQIMTTSSDSLRKSISNKWSESESEAQKDEWYEYKNPLNTLALLKSQSPSRKTTSRPNPFQIFSNAAQVLWWAWNVPGSCQSKHWNSWWHTIHLHSMLMHVSFESSQSCDRLCCWCATPLCIHDHQDFSRLEK